ncbi:MAG: type I restriction endonuclease [Thermoguttaceae bacterium]|jgi:hypothetical protein|nr:type I restriction endonuclease [Thermoguttaceae bacterium]
MDLIDRLRDLSARILKLLEHVQTEEATKTALVMPFLNALGYNVFDPTEVKPEFTADVGTKKGERVDFALMREGKPIVLIECKPVGSKLDRECGSQLYRYFSVTEARFGVLTDGVLYRFFSDLEEPNKMDSRPFFEFSMLEITEEVAAELKRFSKDSFDLESILATASELKFARGIKRVLAEEWENPSDEFVRLLASRVYSGRMTQSVREHFGQITRRAFGEFISERINERLKSALENVNSAGTPAPPSPSVDDEGSSEDDRIETTPEELEGYYVVKAILRESIPVERIAMRDRKSYCGILLDDNNRKPICRLWFNGPQKYLGLFDDAKVETRHPIADVNDIFKFAEQLKQTVRQYDMAKQSTALSDRGADPSGG